MNNGRIGVLFVCLGNICRSPLAEGVFRHMADNQGLGDTFLIDSAGTSTWHVGEPPDSRACEAALIHGFDINHQRARQVRPDDFARFHYILTMDETNLRTLKANWNVGNNAHVGLLLEYSGTGLREVPDPYYGGVEGFQACLDLVAKGAEGLLATIRKERLS